MGGSNTPHQHQNDPDCLAVRRRLYITNRPSGIECDACREAVSDISADSLRAVTVAGHAHLL